MFFLCRLQRRTTWQLPTSEPPRSSFCTPRSEQSPSAWLVPFSPSTPGPGTPSWSSSSSSTSLSPSRCSNFPCPTPCWPPSRRCWRRPSTRLTRRLTFSLYLFYLISEKTCSGPHRLHRQLPHPELGDHHRHDCRLCSRPVLDCWLAFRVESGICTNVVCSQDSEDVFVLEHFLAQTRC